MTLSVHDNFVYAYFVDCEGQRLILHTMFRDREPYEYTDVIFRGLIAHYFEHVLPGNILNAVEEVESATIVDQYATVFAESWRWAWPFFEYRGDVVSLKERLREQAIRGFLVMSSYGLDGWVLAESCERVPRESPAIVG
jgi:hypothetical protein